MNQFQKRNQEKVSQNPLPHNFLAEKTVLSCLLMSPEAVELVTRNLKVEAFYFQNHQEIYKAIIFMHENKSPIDIITLTSFLQDKGLLEQSGGIGVLLELLDNLPSLVYLEEYIRLVNDKFLRRCLIKLGYEITNTGYITNIPVENMFKILETEVFNLTNQIKTKKLVNSAELLTNIFSELKEKFLNPRLPGLTSGFNNLDLLTQGFQKSDLIIIAGRPSIGKTAFSLNIVLNVLKRTRLPILFFSLEMSKEQIMYRLLAMETNINPKRLRSGQLYQNDWLKLTKIIKIMSKLPIFIDDSPNLSIQDIRSKIKTIILEQTQIGIVIIDYLQLMQNLKVKNESRVQEISQITRSLKTIAREFNIPIIALSQLSRSVETRIDQKPILSDLRESGSIEQDADLVLMLYKPKSRNSILESNFSLIDLIIAKHRNGPVGTIQLKFNEKQTKFLDPEKS